MSWDEFFKIESKKPYFIEILRQVDEERELYEIYPHKDEVFKAFELCEPEDVKVVILGQDPYPGFELIDGVEVPHAMGLSFSVKPELKLPKSLISIYKELEDDLGVKRVNGDLSDWAKQGVFLLNTYLTVRKSQALSHHFIDWDIFTNSALKYLLEINPNVIFILWGKHALSAVKNLDIIYNIESAHPSPLSAYRGFFGSKPFSRTNEILNSIDLEEIAW